MQDSNEAIVTQYKYDAYGNCKVYDKSNTLRTDANFIGNIFPLRWKSFYYDKETGLYYANGRYYDPEIGMYLDAMDIPTAISEMYLDRNGIMCDNILEFVACAYSIMTGMSKDPSSTEDDANEGIPWWQWFFIGITVVAAVVVSIMAIAVSGGGASPVVAGGLKILSSALTGGVIGGFMNINNPGGYFAGYMGGFIGGAISGGLGTFRRVAQSVVLSTFVVAISSASSSIVVDIINNVYAPEAKKLSVREITLRATISAAIGAFIGFGVSSLSIGLTHETVAFEIMKSWSVAFANTLSYIFGTLFAPDFSLSGIFGE